ncbi:MAG: DinB family protein [Actinomycetota bacterium]
MADETPYIHAEPPKAGTEVATLLGSLERQRRTFAWKCGGLDAEGLNKRLEPSALTLGGLLKHLALVEDWYFTARLMGEELGPPWEGVDFDADPDWEWRTATDDSPDELMALWEAAVQRSRGAVARALDEGDLDRLAAKGWPDGKPSLRRLLIDLIEEYARHVGHADLIRESIDGLVGEDPPR